MSFYKRQKINLLKGKVILLELMGKFNLRIIGRIDGKMFNKLADKL